MKLLKSYKPSSMEMSDAFYKLVKTSQSIKPPSSKYFKPVVTNSLIVASLRLEDAKAEELLGVRFLPLVSSKDSDLIRVLFYHAHVLDAGPFSLHLNKSGTLARMKQGSYAVIIPHIRKVIDPLLKSCVRCVRNAKNIQTFNNQ